MKKTITTLVAGAALIQAASPALAHPHQIEKNGQVLANGQNHPAFVRDANGNLMSCESNPKPANYGPAWYGLETAHHGPDASGRGRGDGCYQIKGNLSPLDPRSDRNPAIK